MSNKYQDGDPMSSPAARGKRLKIVRLMAGLTRKQIWKKYDISASTIQSWEAAKAGGLTERGVSRMMPVLQQEGIFCSVDWLLYGIGNGPQPINICAQVKENVWTMPALPEDKVITEELLTFRKCNADDNVVDFIISDDGMGPHFSVGDYVGGKRRTGVDIADIIGKDCIIETISNEIFLRRLKAGSRTGVYTLICTNPDTTVDTPTLYDQNLLGAAPVIWHRRVDHDLIYQDGS